MTEGSTPCQPQRILAHLTAVALKPDAKNYAEVHPLTSPRLSEVYFKD
jgi:hypothetical protein